jgi:hypothetical protein
MFIPSLIACGPGPCSTCVLQYFHQHRRLMTRTAANALRFVSALDGIKRDKDRATEERTGLRTCQYIGARIASPAHPAISIARNGTRRRRNHGGRPRGARGSRRRDEASPGYGYGEGGQRRRKRRFLLDRGGGRQHRRRRRRVLRVRHLGKHLPRSTTTQPRYGKIISFSHAIANSCYPVFSNAKRLIPYIQ